MPSPTNYHVLIAGFVFLCLMIFASLSSNTPADPVTSTNHLTLELALAKIEELENSFQYIEASVGVDSTKGGPWVIPYVASSVVEMPRQDFDGTEEFQGGGMSEGERALLGRYYRQVNSVCEYGVGASSVVAANVGVPRFIGIDSAQAWLDVTSKKCPSHYRWVWADIGKLKKMGVPTDPLSQPKWPFYSLAPVMAERPFELYLIDGRFRVACACIALIHGGDDPSKFVVLMHDFNDPNLRFLAPRGYEVIFKVAERVDGTGTVPGRGTDNLVVLRRRKHATREDIMALWWEHKDVIR